MKLQLVLLAAAALSNAAEKPRARDLGVPFHGTPGPLNAITDVASVTVGHTTLLDGTDVRTGVTAVWPRGRESADPVFAAWFSLNGNGEMTGTAWIDESGLLDGPILLTNTHSVGVARDALIAWRLKNGGLTGEWSLPVVAETWDGFLNDINGFHVHPEHVAHALESASAGAVAEGNVGGGTGMVCYGFKGGIGTSSRKTGPYTVAALVQCNCGRRAQLRIAGVPVGEQIGDAIPYAANQPGIDREQGSIIIVLATDAPLLPHQLKRLARRCAMGLARTGSVSQNGSGDLFIAFSTANPGAGGPGVQSARFLSNEAMNPLFEDTADAVEEAIVNAMVGAETMTGFRNHTVIALPHDRLRALAAKPAAK